MILDKEHPPDYTYYLDMLKLIKKYDPNADIGYRKVEQSADAGLNVKSSLPEEEPEKIKKELLNKFGDKISEIYSHSTSDFTIYFKNE